jgi:pimeloyl-ACP methyl ester carboxylesterase
VHAEVDFNSDTDKMEQPEHPSPSETLRAGPARDAAQVQRPKSLPPRSTSAPGHRSSNQVNVHAASPEVMSSLISSLSSISTPAWSHFENLPHIGSYTAPSSPAFPPSESTHHTGHTDRKPSIEQGIGADYALHKAAADADSPFLHPDDAAASPVIRMGPRPPSPRSRTSSRRSSPRRPSSRSSWVSTRTFHEDSPGIGVISAEPGPRVSSALSVASSNSGRRSSLKGSLGLLMKGSREFSQEKEGDIPRRSSNHGDGLMLRVSRSRASLRSWHSMADVAEEGAPIADGVESTSKEERKSSSDVNRMPSQHSLNAPLASPSGIGNGRLIPTRDSSLRHSFSNSSNKKRRSARHSRYSSTGSKDLKIEGGIAEVNNETEQTTRRIQELKEQQKKIRTEMEETEQTSGNSKQSISTPSHSIPRVSSEQHPRPLHGVEALYQDPIEESAPSPAIQTRRVRERKRNGGPLMMKTGNVQPLMGRQSFEKPDQLSRTYSKCSSDPISPLAAKHHKRTPSATLSHGRLSTAEDRPSSADSIDLAVDAYVSSPRLTQRVPHPRTGRMIAFSEVGDPKGHIVFCCLGMGLTRFLMAFYDELAGTLKLRLVTLDRPGVGESEPCSDGSATPLTWPGMYVAVQMTYSPSNLLVDDIAIVCNHLKITKFSILAHSAGAIYALATALRMSQHVRGRIHLLAPWIPPSQMSSIGSHKEPLPSNAVPYSQRILRALPTPILRVANSSLINATSSSITTSLPKSPRRAKRKSIGRETPAPRLTEASPQNNGAKQSAPSQDHFVMQDGQSSGLARSNAPDMHALTDAFTPHNRERQTEYDNRLTFKIWELATANANPAVDLLICLERQRTIGFRYADITRAVVIHHGSRDTRVPVDNVRWLGKMMRRCEVRVLEGEGHGLMASAVVMSSVLTEISKEWEDWTTVVQGKREGRRLTITHPSR